MSDLNRKVDRLLNLQMEFWEDYREQVQKMGNSVVSLSYTPQDAMNDVFSLYNSVFKATSDATRVLLGVDAARANQEAIHVPNNVGAWSVTVELDSHMLPEGFSRLELTDLTTEGQGPVHPAGSMGLDPHVVQNNGLSLVEVKLTLYRLDRSLEGPYQGYIHAVPLLADGTEGPRKDRVRALEVVFEAKGHDYPERQDSADEEKVNGTAV